MILITGGTGFVGASVLQELRGRRIDFRAASRSSLDGFEAVGDINAHTDWSGVLAGVDVVLHLAARVHVMKDTESDPLAAFRAINVDATLNLARQAITAGVKRLVFVSSIKVNGEATRPGLPFTHADVPNPQDPYAHSKLEAEQALFALGREAGLDIVVVRPPLVYGPGVKGNFATMLDWVKRGVPLPLGAVKNRRSLIFVGNLVDLLLRCTTQPEAVGKVFIGSDDRDLSTTEMLQFIAASINRQSRLLPLPPTWLRLAARLVGKEAASSRLLDNLQVDIRFTKQTLNWRPRFQVEEAFRLTTTGGAGTR